MHVIFHMVWDISNTVSQKLSILSGQIKLLYAMSVTSKALCGYVSRPLSWNENNTYPLGLSPVNVCGINSI